MWDVGPTRQGQHMTDRCPKISEDLDLGQLAMTTQNPASEQHLAPAEIRSEAELQKKLKEFLQQLSPEQLHELAEFAGYLAEAEGETITQELLAIPGLRSQLKSTPQQPESLTSPSDLPSNPIQ